MSAHIYVIAKNQQGYSRFCKKVLGMLNISHILYNVVIMHLVRWCAGKASLQCGDINSVRFGTSGWCGAY